MVLGAASAAGTLMLARRTSGVAKPVASQPEVSSR
jgi:hypothetical protein